MMEYLHEYIIFFLSIIVSIIGFFLKRFMLKVDCLEKALAEHKEKDVEKYATKDELRYMSEDFKEFLDAVISPVNRKLESIEASLRVNTKK